MERPKPLFEGNKLVITLSSTLPVLLFAVGGQEGGSAVSAAWVSLRGNVH